MRTPPEAKALPERIGARAAVRIQNEFGPVVAEQVTGTTDEVQCQPGPRAPSRPPARRTQDQDLHCSIIVANPRLYFYVRHDTQRLLLYTDRGIAS